MKVFTSWLALAVLVFGVGCSNQNNISYKDGVQKALEQADLKDVTVSEDKDKNTITLGGKLHSDDAKAKAAEVAKSAAGTRIIANEISVQPVGSESEAKDVASNLDDAIETQRRLCPRDAGRQQLPRPVVTAGHLDKGLPGYARSTVRSRKWVAQEMHGS